jgi:biopolymer transport protein ExbB
LRTVTRGLVELTVAVPSKNSNEALGRTLGSASFPAAALEAVQRVGGSAGRVLAAGLHRFDRSPVQIEMAMERQGQAELRRLQRGLGVLTSTSVAAPLLGFLGTVTGMIASFGAPADFSTTNPALVAEGIEEALITTAAGLAVAVPVHLIHGVLSSRVSRIVNDIEDLAHLLLDLRERRDGGAGSSVPVPVVP